MLAATLGSDEATVRTCLRMLLDRGILTEQSPEAEQAAIVQALQGHDPAAALDRYRRARMEGSHPYWAVEAPHTLTEANRLHRRLDILLLGDCDVQMETDFLRREAGRRGIDLRAAASFAADTELARDRHHDAIIIGALQARHAIVVGDPEHHDGDPARVYVQAVTSHGDEAAGPDRGADPDRRPAGTHGAAAGFRGSRRPQPPQPIPSDKSGAGAGGGNVSPMFTWLTSPPP